MGAKQEKEDGDDKDYHDSGSDYDNDDDDTVLFIS